MNKEKLTIKICGIIFSSFIIFYLTFSNIKADLIHLYYLLTLVAQVALTWEAFLLFLKYLDKKNDWKNSLTKRLLFQITGGIIVVLFAFTLIQLIEYPLDKLIIKRHRLHGYWDFDIFICLLLAIIIQLVYVIYYFLSHWKRPVQQEKNHTTRNDFISRIGNRQIVLSENEILCFFTENKTVFALTQDKNKYILDFSLEKITEKVSLADFHRVNRQFILKKSSIKGIKSLPNNRLSIDPVFSSDTPIIISRKNTPQFRKWFNS
jgi:ABC-type multidrug transport system fused ATPase/permease subunit